jgi:hypothetical protein
MTELMLLIKLRNGRLVLVAGSDARYNEVSGVKIAPGYIFDVADGRKIDVAQLAVSESDFARGKACECKKITTTGKVRLCKPAKTRLRCFCQAYMDNAITVSPLN